MASRGGSGRWTGSGRLGIAAAIRRVAKGWRLDGEAVERVVFALVAQRALKPGSKLAGTKWVAERVAIEGCAGFSEDAAYAGTDFLLDALDDIAAEVFASFAHLLHLDVDLELVDTTSTHCEVDVADELLDLSPSGQDDGNSRPVESGVRALQGPPPGDLPQVVIAMAVTRDRVGGWNLHWMVWVADRGFASAANRAYLIRGGGHYINAEKLRHTNSEAARASPAGPGRTVVCHNPEQADRDAAVPGQGWPSDGQQLRH